MELLDDLGDKADSASIKIVRRLQGIHVLVVDDEEDMVQLYTISLRAAGATVHSECDGASALGALRDGNFDIVVSDLDMPLVDGIAMIRAMRALKAFGPLPALAITGSTRTDARAHALLAGFDAFAEKPLSATKLVEAVKDLLRKSIGSDT
jgi:two-component system, chemotaxis family, CheB/CheR fusion protein